MRCPGGRPGSCADGRYGIGCAACFPGWTPSYDGMCERCSDSWQLMPFAIACLAASNFLIAIYSFRPTAKTSHTFGLCIICGSHFVTMLQFAGVLQSIIVPWTNLLLNVFQVSDLLFLDAKLLRPSCVSNHSGPQTPGAVRGPLHSSTCMPCPRHCGKHAGEFAFMHPKAR